MVLTLAIAVAGAYLSLVPEPPALAAVSGDVNCDETTNSVDALGVLRSIAGLGTPDCNDAADVNCDDGVNAIDSLFILRFVAGLSVSLPAGCPPLGTATSLPLLNEVQFLPAPGRDPFVELKNGGAGAASLDGLSLADNSNQTYALPGGLPALAADEVLLIVFDGGSSVAGNVVHASPIGFLDSESGSVELRDGSNVLDHVAWGVGQPNAVPLSTGGMWGDPEPGLTLGRAPGLTDVGPPVWSPYGPDHATPGAANGQPVVDAMLPFDGALLPPGDITLNWYPVAGATSYEVQVASNDVFDSPVVDETVTAPEVEATLPAGNYFWRIRTAGTSAASISTTQTFTLDAGAFSAALAPNAVSLSVPQIKQHKDTAMLLLESDRETGAHAWDKPHPDLDVNDRADNWNCALAALAMLNEFFGGDLSQDRIGFEVFRDRTPGPEVDLNWGHGLNYPGQVEEAFEFAVGVPAMAFPAYQRNTDEEWAFVTEALDLGDPLLTTTRQHSTVITGYSEANGKKYVHLNDPWLGPYRTDLALARFVWFWRPSVEPDPPDDEPAIHADSDNDGMIDFDETNRFGTNPLTADTDRDTITDRSDVGESVFGDFGYSAFGWVDGTRDWDSDGAPNERDCDSDNDGEDDGQDPDDWTSPPTPPDPATCGPGYAVVTLTWFTDTNLALWVLPDPASNEEEALAQAGQPGWWSRIGGWCNPPSGADDVPRTAVIGDLHPIEPETRYIAVKFVDFCRRGVPGPEDDGPQTSSFILTVQYADGRVQQIADEFSWQTDDWRLHGPFDLAPGQSPVQEVRLAWDSVTDLNLYVLPLPATGESQAYAQHLLPGYGDDVDYECVLVPDSVTQREAVVTEVTVESKYIGVYFNHKCPYNPEGPHGSSDYVLTVHFADGQVEMYSGFLSRDIDRPGETWRLYGPFDLAAPLP